MSSSTYSAKIGLMYVSDYMYGATPENWTLIGYGNGIYKSYKDAKSFNWLYGGLFEWSITVVTNSDTHSYAFSYDGDVTDSGSRWIYRSARPCFYLNTNITYKSGSGSMDDPIFIN